MLCFSAYTSCSVSLAVKTSDETVLNRFDAFESRGLKCVYLYKTFLLLKPTICQCIYFSLIYSPRHLFCSLFANVSFLTLQAVAASRQMEATGYVETTSKDEEGVTDAFELCGLAAIGSKPRFASLVRRHAPHLKRHIHSSSHRSCNIMQVHIYTHDKTHVLYPRESSRVVRTRGPQPCCLLGIDTRDCDFKVVLRTLVHHRSETIKLAVFHI